MKFEKTIFGGQSFKYPEDFEKAFRPTKWSIRKFVRFALSLDPSERDEFTNYTKYVLSISYTDMDTKNFIRQINKKSKYDYGMNPSWEYERVGIVSIKKKHASEFIATMAGLRKRGIIQCSGVQLAEIIKKQFHIKYSLSTIKYKIYKYESDIE